jgi:hypothetical protein
MVRFTKRHGADSAGMLNLSDFMHKPMALLIMPTATTPAQKNPIAQLFIQSQSPEVWMGRGKEREKPTHTHGDSR